MSQYAELKCLLDSGVGERRIVRWLKADRQNALILSRTFTTAPFGNRIITEFQFGTDFKNLKDNVFRIKHAAEFLYDAGDSMISLEHVRALVDNPPDFKEGSTSAFCDFAGPGAESVLGICQGNRAGIVDSWRSRDTMHSVGKFLAHFRRLGLQGYQIGVTKVTGIS